MTTPTPDRKFETAAAILYIADTNRDEDSAISAIEAALDDYVYELLAQREAEIRAECYDSVYLDELCYFIDVAIDEQRPDVALRKIYRERMRIHEERKPKEADDA